ncbi:MAG TPA: acyl-CoA dehydrogenase C-terminal domain-containing protein [Polyangiaceae bacterium]|nr:acyl-CoA dehydrogenase C-terminal domain-containing protein [Polyangiaceae bacterium]
MQIYRAPIQEMKFLLEAFGYDQVSALPAYSDFDLDTTVAMLEQAGTFASEVLLPINRVGDKQGLRWDAATGDVTTPPGFKEAYARMVENGFVGICGDREFGGGGGPITLATFLNEFWISGNKSFSMCLGLSQGLIDALEMHANEEQKRAYLGKLVTGEWAGTMCLTEPQAGTDLGLVRTKAEPDGDRHRLTGNKIWITFGEHDFTENIVHFVLARLPDAPPGIKGISTFVVPKITSDGKRNNIKCAGLEHKMGIHASPTCVMDLDGAEGWLVGEPHRGMRAMFTMMNGARLLVGVEGIALGEISYQTALAFAKERRQSRALDPDKRDRNEPADNILVHPDVRRMLLNIKASNEAMRGLACWVSINIDLSRHHPDEQVRQEADDLVALLTPIVKSYCTERGFFNISEAMQLCGGAGYTADMCIEQYLRDERIAMIYEGTNHVQALDLVGRKLPRDGGRAFQVFCKRLGAFIAEHAKHPELGPLAKELDKSLGRLMALTGEFGAKAMADPEMAGAAASNYLNLFALTALGYCWCVQAAYALAQGGARAQTKLKTARYFFDMLMPEAEALERMIRAGKEPIMSFAVDEL